MKLLLFIILGVSMILCAQSKAAGDVIGEAYNSDDH